MEGEVMLGRYIEGGRDGWSRGRGEWKERGEEGLESRGEEGWYKEVIPSCQTIFTPLGISKKHNNSLETIRLPSEEMAV
jgi:hypothetical protein